MGVVQRFKLVECMFDLIVNFEYSIIQSIPICENVILSNQLTLLRIDADLLGRIHIICCNLEFCCAGFYEISFVFRRPILHLLQIGLQILKKKKTTLFLCFYVIILNTAFLIGIS